VGKLDCWPMASLRESAPQKHKRKAQCNEEILLQIMGRFLAMMLDCGDYSGGCNHCLVLGSGKYATAKPQITVACNSSKNKILHQEYGSPCKRQRNKRKVLVQRWLTMSYGKHVIAWLRFRCTLRLKHAFGTPFFWTHRWR